MIQHGRLMIVAPDEHKLERVLQSAEGVPIVTVTELPEASTALDILSVIISYEQYTQLKTVPIWIRRVALVIYNVDAPREKREQLFNTGAFIVTPSPLDELNLNVLYHGSSKFLAVQRERDHLQVAMSRIDHFGRRISVVESPSALLDTIPNLLVALLPFDAMAIWDTQENNLRLFIPYDWDQRQNELVTSQIRTLLSRQPQVTSLPATTVRVEFDPGAQRILNGGVKHHLITRVGALRGLIGIFRIGNLPFERDDDKLFDLAANLITSALHNARLFDRLEDQARKIVMKNRELLAANRLKTNFIANTSHELKTPLHSILGLTELLADAESPEELQRMAERIGINAQRLLDIVNDLLDYSRLISDKVAVYFETISIPEFIDEVIDNVKDLADVKAIQLQKEIAGDFQHFRCDREKLFRILINLLNNAIKFTPSGNVQFTVKRDRAHALFVVTDTGIGIAPQNLTKIFEQFHRVKGPLQNAREGTGLGLTIAQGLARLLGGNIMVQSTEGAGSTFTLQLPLDNGDIDSERISLPNPDEGD